LFRYDQRLGPDCLDANRIKYTLHVDLSSQRSVAETGSRYVDDIVSLVTKAASTSIRIK